MEATVEYNYAAQELDELTLRKGDIIKDIKIMPGGWWQGTLREKRGMFPDNFVKVVEPCSSIGALKEEPQESKKEEIKMRNGSSGRKWCKVLFSYEPCNEDELGLVPNETIEFLEEVEEGWWSGRLRGRIGVFPSNFVSPPMSEEHEKHTNRDTAEYCRVLFPYSAANEDELTLVEGDIVTITSRDAPDKGWWRGELCGKIGLFPDNFVEMINTNPDSSEQAKETRQDPNQIKINAKSTNSSKHSLIAGKRSERPHVRKSVDTRVINSVRQLVAVSPFVSSGKKSIDNQSSNLKRLIDKSSNVTTDINTAGVIADVEINEELDGVERKEDTPLLHLTALRAKAPRRRLPSSHHVRNQAVNVSATVVGTASSASLKETVLNGTIDTVDQSRDEESENLIGRTRRKAPWIEELKLNQIEKKKSMPTVKVDKLDIITARKDNTHVRPPMSLSGACNINVESCQVCPEIQVKDNEKDLTYSISPGSPTASSSSIPTYVPYHLYYQLLDKVITLQERQTVLERTVAQLSEQIISQSNNSPTYQ